MADAPPRALLPLFCVGGRWRPWGLPPRTLPFAARRLRLRPCPRLLAPAKTTRGTWNLRQPVRCPLAVPWRRPCVLKSFC